MKTYEGSAQAYNVAIEHNVMTSMPDGVKLAADIYFPALDGTRAPGTFPVILERTPYNKAAPAQVTKGKYFARRGYVCVIQDVRGRFASEGEWYAFAEEAGDGYATVEWLGTQPWSTGKVGTMGDSYAGSDQSALATLNPPHLATMIVAVGASNYYHSSMRHNGALEQRFLIYAFRMAATSKEAEADPALKGALQQVLMEKVPGDGAAVPPQGRHDPAAPPAVVRALGLGRAHPRRLRRLLEGLQGLHAERVLRGARRRADAVLGRLVRLLRPQHPRKLRASQRHEAIAAVPVDGTVDARPV